MNAIEKRENWIDDLKIFACILVVLGHFFQSMIKSNIYQESDIIMWFLKTIYYFHVPLFFICSGYLYQKTVHIEHVGEWLTNIKRKAISLGVPYILFSTITWILKSVFSGSVNTQILPLHTILLLHPESPYWYLYTLFFLFVCIPVLKSKNYYLLILALLGKIGIIMIGDTNIFLISTILNNAIWFVMGMYINEYNLQNKVINHEWKRRGNFACVCFIILSYFAYRFESGAMVSFSLGSLACFAFVLMALNKTNRRRTPFGEFLKKSTWIVFLMHTLFAATMRSILFKLGINNPIVHTVVGLSSSFIGPMIIVWLMRYWGWIEKVFYPEKIKGNRNK